jgi:hypothetical protein
VFPCGLSQSIYGSKRTIFWNPFALVIVEGYRPFDPLVASGTVGPLKHSGFKVPTKAEHAIASRYHNTQFQSRQGRGKDAWLGGHMLSGRKANEQRAILSNGKILGITVVIYFWVDRHRPLTKDCITQQNRLSLGIHDIDEIHVAVKNSIVNTPNTRIYHIKWENG